jgi:hypothetical protein
MGEAWLINSDRSLENFKKFLDEQYAEHKHLTLQWKTGKQRTQRQNNALQQYCKDLADALNEAGLDMKKVMKPEVDIPWSKDAVREHLWRPIMTAVTDKTSTTKLTRDEVTEIYDVINRHMAQKHGIVVQFPSE